MRYIVEVSLSSNIPDLHLLLYLDTDDLFVIFLSYIVEIKRQATIRRILCAETDKKLCLH